MATPKTPAQISKKRIVNELLASGIDFFNASIDELETNAKFSIVHFATALELILKTRIANEHWALLVEKSENISSDKFLKGDFQTVQASKLVDRINELCSKEILREEKDAYRDIFAHRNQIIHYYHQGLSKKKLKDEIVRSQVLAWYFIAKRLKLWESTHLKSHKKHIDDLIMKMAKLKTYSAAIFGKLSDEISEAKAQGKCVCYCFICGNESSVEQSVLDEGDIFSILFTHCEVCGFNCARVVGQCPSCKSRQVFDGALSGEFICSDCGCNVLQSLEQEAITHEVHCPTCGGDNVFLDKDKIYVCLSCGEAGGIETASCEYCNTQYFSFDPEYSYGMGCGCVQE